MDTEEQEQKEENFEVGDKGEDLIELVNDLAGSPVFHDMMNKAFVNPIMAIIKSTQQQSQASASEHPGRSKETKEFDADFVVAFGQILKAKKDANNPHVDKKYASLDACYDSCRKALSDNGIGVRQFTLPETDPYILRLVTKLVHKSGQWESSLYRGRVQSQRAVIIDGEVQTYLDLWGKKKQLTEWQDTTDPQAYGIFMTYMRRYQLMAMVGIAPSDDIDNRPKDQDSKEPISTTTAGQGSKAKDKKTAEKEGEQIDPRAGVTLMPDGKVEKLKRYIEKQGMTPEGQQALFGVYKIKSLDQLPEADFSAFTKAILTAKKLDGEKK